LRLTDGSGLQQTLAGTAPFKMDFCFERRNGRNKMLKNKAFWEGVFDTFFEHMGQWRSGEEAPVVIEV